MRTKDPMSKADVGNKPLSPPRFIPFVIPLALLLLWPLPASALFRPDGVALWPNGRVPVCWEIGPATDGSGDARPARAHPDFARLSAVIRDVVDEGWGRAANVFFENWGDCPSNAPASNRGMVAIHWEPIGERTSTGFNATQWTRMRLNPDRLADEADFRATVLHEFGHALGFEHEMDRRDWPEQPLPACQSSRIAGTNAEVNFNRTPPDALSIMGYSYCSSSLGRLSPWDIVGLQTAYGRKPAGSLVGMNNRCLDVPSAAYRTGSLLQIFMCLGGENQRWTWSSDNSLHPSAVTDLNLDVRGASITPGTGVQLFSRVRPAPPNQQWKFENVRLKGIGNKCADVPGAQYVTANYVQIYECHGGANQTWTLRSEGVIAATGGAGSLCLDVPDGRAVQGVALQLHPCHGGPAQRFRFTDLGEIKFGPLCVDVRGGDVEDGGRLQLYECHGRPNQKWHVSGWVRTIGRACLDIRNRYGVNNAAAEISRCEPSLRSQEWDYYIRPE